MFTGIIEELGKIAGLEKYGGGAKIKVSAKIVTEDSKDGDSIAVNGVCLTAIDITPNSFSAAVSPETLNLSTLERLKINTVVNLERAVTPATRLGGHIVQGHIDGKGKFLQAVNEGKFWTVRIGFPNEIAPYLVYKGSISVEGISLTIADLTDAYFSIAVIPKTWELTNLSSLQNGDEVNLEADIIAKYVERIMLYGKREEKSEEITMEKLDKLGFV